MRYERAHRSPSRQRCAICTVWIIESWAVAIASSWNYDRRYHVSLPDF